jgi:AcrR family transcriptional regulator
MAAQDRPTRQYSSPLRDEQAARTREQILDALTELLADHRADEITTRMIAEGARVSQPTVYRHFPDRTALMEGLAARVEDLAEGSAIVPMTIDEWISRAVAAFVIADENAVVATAEVILNSDPRRYSEPTRQRSIALVQSLADALPELDDRDQARVGAMFRVLGSAQTWLRMREEFGLTGAESGEVVGWALGVLANAIRAGDFPTRSS